MRTLRMLAVFGFVVFSLLPARHARAAQQVTLQSGAVLVGEVSMDGAELVVDVDGAKLRIPFKDVAMVASAGERGEPQAERLLLRALESRLEYGAGREMGVLAEAYRLAPDDARIAYWYARSMADAGYGKGAREVFQQHREAIAEAYPGLAPQLATLIERRIRLESLPARLVKRLDEIDRASVGASFYNDGDLHAAFFRVVDQHGQPLPADAYRISCNGSHEKTETFGDGYVLFTFTRQGNYDQQPCRINIQKSLYRDDSFEFQGERGGAGDAGVFTAYRFGDADRVKAAVAVVDAAEEPLAGVTVSVTPTRGGDADVAPQTTGDDGATALSVYPGQYVVRGAKDGYNAASESLKISSDGVPEPVKLTMHRLLVGQAKVQWRMRSVGYPGPPTVGGESVSLGEAEVSSTDEMRGPYGPGVPWLRFVQNGDKLQLQFASQPYYPNATAEDFVGRYVAAPADGETAASQSPADQFAGIDLEKIDELKKSLDLRPSDPRVTRGRPAIMVDADAGAIFVGRLASRDMQTGRPAVYEFKVLVTEVGLSEP